MTVEELLDKQNDLVFVLVCENCDCGKNVHCSKSKPYIIKDFPYIDKIYDEYGDREVDYYCLFNDPYNRIVMGIKVEDAQ